MTSPAIAMENVTKTFRTGRILRSLLKGAPGPEGTQVFSNVSLQVFPGEVFGLLGPNGAGKTTLLEILATLLLPTGGQAHVCGHDVVREAAGVRKLLSYCPSALESFYPRLTSVQNLEFFAVLNDLHPQEARARIAATLELVGLDGASKLPFQRFSEGMKQRLALARALLTDPPVLLLDEPTKSLDPLLQGEIRKFLRRTLVEKLEKTVLLVTQNLAEAEEACDRLAILHGGRIVSVGTPGEMKRTLGEGSLAVAFERAVGPGR